MNKEQTPKNQPANDGQTLTNVGDNLYRSDKSKRYYAIFKRNGKQIRCSLKTTDKQLAQRKLAELRNKIDQLDTGDAAKIAFSVLNTQGEVVGGLFHQYTENILSSLKPKTRQLNIHDAKTFVEAFTGQPVRNISIKNVEAWATQRRQETSAGTFNRQLGLLKRVFAYAITHGIRIDNPTATIKRMKKQKSEPVIPTHQQFIALIEELRKISENAAAFVEAMAYSGCRVSELGGDKEWTYPPLCWKSEETNVNFEAGTFTVVGKGRKTRTVPLFPAFKELLLRMRNELPAQPASTDRIFAIENPRDSLKKACKKLGVDFSNHDFRHFFCTNAIEKGRTYMTIAGWLGHDDGGRLVASTYGHLRQEHSMQAATEMTFSAPQPTSSNSTNKATDAPEIRQTACPHTEEQSA